MAQQLLIDTDIIIDIGRNSKQAIDFLQSIERKSSPTISVVTQMELLVGCRNKKEMNTLSKFLERFKILHIDEKISSIAVDLMSKYRLSHGLLIADSLIAATAIKLKIVFSTKNHRDFRFINGLNLLTYPTLSSELE